ncbi:hypothetical protein [Streptodolium elevatio]
MTVLDRDPRDVGMAGRPVRPVRPVRRDGSGRVRPWVPQVFARYADGPGLSRDVFGFAGRAVSTGLAANVH